VWIGEGEVRLYEVSGVVPVERIDGSPEVRFVRLNQRLGGLDQPMPSVELTPFDDLPAVATDGLAELVEIYIGLTDPVTVVVEITTAVGGVGQYRFELVKKSISSIDTQKSYRLSFQPYLNTAASL